jgi:hypothetical protein
MEKQMTINRAFLILLAVLLLPSLAWAQTDTRATFNVTKDFNDNNPAYVDVQIDCNSGQILDQDKQIAEGDGVQFVVTEFTAGITDCTITEDAFIGYEALYNDGSESAVNCSYDNIGNGADVQCVITNTLQPVAVEVFKEWIFEGEGGDVIDERFQIELVCRGIILNEGAENLGGGYWSLTFNGEGEDNFKAFVLPRWDGSTYCDVNENVFDSSVESDTSDCEGDNQLHPTVNNGDSCTVVNTVFYEGIPTLSQYGMAILALLMLGVGFVGLRRFV